MYFLPYRDQVSFLGQQWLARVQTWYSLQKQSAHDACRYRKSIWTWRPFYGTYANSTDPDQMTQKVAFDLGIHCLLSYCSTKIWIKTTKTSQQPFKRKWTGPFDWSGISIRLKWDKTISIHQLTFRYNCSTPMLNWTRVGLKGNSPEQITLVVFWVFWWTISIDSSSMREQYGRGHYVTLYAGNPYRGNCAKQCGTR